MSESNRSPDDTAKLLRERGVLEGLAVALGQYVNEVVSARSAVATDGYGPKTLRRPRAETSLTFRRAGWLGP